MIGKRTPFTKATAAEYFAVIDRGSDGNRRERRRAAAFKRRASKSALYARYGTITRAHLGLEKVEPQPLARSLRAMVFGYYDKVMRAFAKAFGRRR